MSEYVIDEIYDGTWRICENDIVCFFVLKGRDFALLIDSGMETTNAREMAEELTHLPVKLLNTHADVDHTGSNAEFDEFMMNPAEAANYYKGMRSGTGNIIPLADGEIIDLGNRKLEVVYLPGHTPGSIGLIDLDNRAFFSGDVVQNSNIYMFGVHRELHAFIVSLEKLEKMTDKFDIIYGSHGDISVSPDIIPVLKKGAEDLLAGRLTGVPMKVHDNPLIRYDLGVAGMYYDK